MKNIALILLALAMIFAAIAVGCSSKETVNPNQTYICQSCGMPMETGTDFGTNFNSTKNMDYCHICYKNGKFTEPSITMEQMIEKTALMNSQMQGIEETLATEMARNLIPKLKRWK